MNTLTALPVVVSEASIVGAEPTEPHADAELIALGEQLKLASDRAAAFYAKADQLRRGRKEYEAALAALPYRDWSDADRELAECLDWGLKGQDLSGRVFFPLYIEALEAKAVGRVSSRAASRLSELVAAAHAIDLCDSSPEFLEMDECAAQAHDAAAKIVERMEGLNARTLDGIKAKIAAVRFCRAGDFNDNGREEAAADARLVDSMLLDLTAL